MNPLITLRRLLTAVALVALTLAAVTALIPSDEQTLEQLTQPKHFFFMATLAFGFTPALVSRNEYSTARGFSILLIANLLILAALIAGWNYVNQQIPSPKLFDLAIYLLFLVGLIAFWKHALKNDPKLRVRTELAIPALMACFSLQCWLFPKIQYSEYSDVWWVPSAIIAAYV
ncbi:hypothetical protein N9Y42_10790, partial [Mariniblastus sp.]|nr:hypothetical protein [Mariniblastus sp.]